MERIALVTGASRGIGKSCAVALLQEGWTVVCAGRQLEGLQSTIESAGAVGAKGHARVCDVGREDQVTSLFEGIQKQFGRLDLLFNNAGIFSRSGTPDELTGEEWRQAVDTNLNGMFYCLSQAFKLMRANTPPGGRIINNGSISAHTPRPGSMAYTATKHAISGMTKSASLDGRPFDIAVGQIDIGNVASDMTAAMAAGVRQADGSIKPEARMDMDAVVQTFMNMVRLPLSANVLFTTVMATTMPYVGRG